MLFKHDISVKRSFFDFFFVFIFDILNENRRDQLHFSKKFDMSNHSQKHFIAFLQIRGIVLMIDREHIKFAFQNR